MGSRTGAELQSCQGAGPAPSPPSWVPRSGVTGRAKAGEAEAWSPLSAGLWGLVVAVMVAGLMSSLTSGFNSSSTPFAMALWKPVRPRTSEQALMVVGR